MIPEIFPALDEYFGEHKVLAAEEKLYEPVKEYVELDYNFKGFIDLISFLIGVPEKILLLKFFRGIILSNGIKIFDAKGSKILFALPIIAFCS